MTGLRYAIKLGSFTVVVLLLISIAFVVGYEMGSVEDSGGATGANITSQVGAEPTNAAPPTHTSGPSPTSGANPTPEAVMPPNATSPSEGVRESEQAPTAEIAPEAESDLTDDESLGVLHEVWDLVEKEFYGELPPPEERVYAAIRGMLNTLDDEYTSFSEPSIAAIRRADASGSFEGIGALVTMNDDNILEIVQLYEDSPADRAGLRAGDLVLAVDDQSIVGYGIFEAITLIRGPEGTEVELTVKRGDAEPFNVQIIRARLDIRIIASRMLENDIAYVSLFEFSSKATQRLEETLEELFKQDPAGLIFDLRGNPGGFLPQAVQVADLFLDEGLILIERRSDGQEIEYTSTDEGMAQDIPLVVLVNGGSASASEIVAGAIQDRDRGVMIGATTFGKGSVQLLHTLSDGSELRVTVARWFTPNDRAIHGHGLTPDIEIPMTAEDQETERDPQLERAIEYLSTMQ